MTARRWSLARRMTLGFAVTTTGLVVAIASVSAWFLNQSVNRELDGLAVEELDEVRAIFSSREFTREVFEDVTVDLASQHPGTQLAWRVWEPGATQPLLEEGNDVLLARYRLPLETPDGPVAPGQGLRWLVVPLCLGSLPSIDHEAEYRVGLLIDGSARFATLRRYGLVALVLVAFAALAAILGGAIFSRRVSLQLRVVAASVRGVQLDEGMVDMDIAHAPEEVRDVIVAFRETLKNIRAESDRARMLITGMAHELRSPIQNLLGETDVLLIKDRSIQEYCAALESHAEELRDLGRGVDNLVTLCSGSQSGEILEYFDLGEEAQMRLARERAQASRRGLDLELVSEGDLRVQGDREALLLVLRNLVGNAIEWSEAGQTVRVRLQGDTVCLVMTVEDEGQGIPEDERDRIFEPFYSGRSKNGRRAGYGLGLALSRQAIERHAGTITVSESASGGALFRVVLPKQD